MAGQALAGGLSRSNHEYTWDAPALVLPRWPEHPHLVHEIAVIADQRRRSGLAKTSDALEEWHRYCLPAFMDGMKGLLPGHCDDDHAPWPGRPRQSDYTATPPTRRRGTAPWSSEIVSLPTCAVAVERADGRQTLLSAGHRLAYPRAPQFD